MTPTPNWVYGPDNPLLRSDSYKATHWKMYPPKTEYVYSYLEARGFDEDYDIPLRESVFFGLQYKIKEFFGSLNDVLFGSDKDFEQAINGAKQFCIGHFNRNDIFNESGWRYIRSLGHIPLKIYAVPEGSIIPNRNVLMTVVNTDPKCYWLPNWVETELLQIWAPTQTATISREVKKTIRWYLETTSELDCIAALPFMLHDFGYRGASSRETARVNGMGHLVNFLGSDTMDAAWAMMHYYNADMPASSVPATEHSIMASLGKSGESDVIRHCLETYPDGIISIVGDTYNIWEVCKTILPGMEHLVTARNGLVVIRPDSGPPAETVKKCLELLAGKFGWSNNSKGFKVLSPVVKVLWGDGIGPSGVDNILSSMMQEGWAASNIATFGMGGGLIQKHNRDTMKWAFKCSAQCHNGIWIPNFKDPVTDPGKSSKKGTLALKKYKTADDIHYKYVTMQDITASNLNVEDNILLEVYNNGILHEQALSDIRIRAEI